VLVFFYLLLFVWGFFVVIFYVVLFCLCFVFVCVFVFLFFCFYIFFVCLFCVCFSLSGGVIVDMFIPGCLFDLFKSN